MTLQEVQFCYAIACGQDVRARELITRIDVNQNDDWGLSPALLCLWALNHTPEMLAKKLEDFHKECFSQTNENSISTSIPTSKESMDTLIRELVLPALKGSLNQLLKPIGLKVVSLDKISDAKQDMFVDSAFAAVNLIINDEFFDDINASQRRFADSLFSKLIPLVEKIQAQAKTAAALHSKPQADKPSKEQPYTIQLLMAIINGKAHDLPNMPALNLHPTLAPIGRTYLPGAQHAMKVAATSCHTETKREETPGYRRRVAPGVH